jgi:hypothetical protein
LNPEPASSGQALSEIVGKTTEKPPNFFHTSYSEGLPLKARTNPAETWISPLLLLLFFIAAILFSFFTKELKTLFFSPFRKDGIRKLNAEENFLVRRTLLSLLLIFLLALPVLIYQTLGYYGFHPEVPLRVPLYIQLLGLCAGLIGMKLVVVRFAGILFLCKKEAEIYLHAIMLMFSAAGLLLIPLCLAGRFISGEALGLLLGGAWILVGVSYASGLITGAAAALRSLRISSFHLILYFCTLELIPAILIIKLVRNLA